MTATEFCFKFGKSNYATDKMILQEVLIHFLEEGGSP